MKEFQSFGTFARHLGRLALIGEEVTHHITEEGAKIIQTDAKAKLGTYQGYAGPFNAWKGLSDSTMAARELAGYPPNEPLLVTGELRDSIDISVEGDKAIVGSEIDKALYQECGTEKGGMEHIPPRPFLGPAAFEAKLPIGEMSARTLIAWISGLGWKRPPKFDLPGASVD